MVNSLELHIHMIILLSFLILIHYYTIFKNPLILQEIIGKCKKCERLLEVGEVMLCEECYEKEEKLMIYGLTRKNWKLWNIWKRRLFRKGVLCISSNEYTVRGRKRVSGYYCKKGGYMNDHHSHMVCLNGYGNGCCMKILVVIGKS